MTPRLCLGALALVLAAIGSGCGSDDASAPKQGTGGAGATGGTAGQSGAAGSSGPLSLAPGDVAEITVNDGAGSVQLETPTGTERFVVVLASQNLDDVTSTYSYSISTTDSAAENGGQNVTGCSLTSDVWKSKQLPAEAPPAGTGAQLGDERSIQVGLPNGGEAIQAKAIAVGQSAVVWADITAAHPAVIDAAVVQEFLDDFEKIILPRARQVFGVESDTDKDGHIALVFTPLTYQTAVAFFTSCDLKPSIGCPGGNQGEYLYLTPPNAIDPPYNTPAAIKEILAHELAHMIHFHRKVLKNNIAGNSESAYMHEGVGAFSQDSLGFQAGNFYVTKAGLDEIDLFSLSSTLKNGVQYDLSRDGALRGGSYLFVRWFYDRAGGDTAKSDGNIENQGGPALLRAVLDSPKPIAEALPELAGSSMDDLAMDFWTTLAASNRDVAAAGGVAPTNSCFAYLPTQLDPLTARQRGANLFAEFHGQQMNGPHVQALADADGSLRAGGAEFVQVDASPGQGELDVSITADVAASPRVRVLRVQ
ncbi:MAG: hypothetical protein R3B13_27640 [Polyangiaceae bacterium]